MRISLGYSENKSAYICVHRASGRIVESRDVVFDEGTGKKLDRVEIDVVTREEKTPDLDDKSLDGGDNDPGYWETLSNDGYDLIDPPIEEDQARSPPELEKMPRAT